MERKLRYSDLGPMHPIGLSLCPACLLEGKGELNSIASLLNNMQVVHRGCGRICEQVPGGWYQPIFRMPLAVRRYLAVLMSTEITEEEDEDSLRKGVSVVSQFTGCATPCRIVAVYCSPDRSAAMVQMERLLHGDEETFTLAYKISPVRLKQPGALGRSYQAVLPDGTGGWLAITVLRNPIEPHPDPAANNTIS
jgi:hypothetical protein